MDNQRNSNQSGVLFLISVQYYLKNLMKNALFVILQMVVLAEQLQWTKSEKKIRFWKISKQIGTIPTKSHFSHYEPALRQFAHWVCSVTTIKPIVTLIYTTTQTGCINATIHVYEVMRNLIKFNFELIKKGFCSSLILLHNEMEGKSIPTLKVS